MGARGKLAAAAPFLAATTVVSVAVALHALGLAGLAFDELFLGLRLVASVGALAWLAAIALQPLGRCRGGAWRAALALAASFGIGALVFAPLTLPDLAYRPYELAPFSWIALLLVAFAARATASTRSLGRWRTLLSVTIALLLMGALSERSFIGLGASVSPHYTSLQRLAMLAHVRSSGSAAGVVFDGLAAAGLFAEVLRRRARARALFAVLTLGCIAAALRDGLDLWAAERVFVALGGLRDEGHRGLAAGGLAPIAAVGIVARYAEWLVGGAFGVACVVALPRVLRESTGQRRLLRFALPLALAGAWLAVAEGDSGFWRSLDAGIRPAWRELGIEPVFRDGPIGFPYGLRQQVWIFDRHGEPIARSTDEPPADPLYILADRRAPLERVVRYVRGLGRAFIGVRSSSTRELDAMPQARDRFPLIEVLSRSGAWVPMDYDASPRSARSASYDRTRWHPTCILRPSWFEASFDSACDDPSSTQLVLDEIPPEATVDELHRRVDEVRIAAHDGDVRSTLPGNVPVVDANAPTVRSSFGSAFVAALLIALATMLVMARARWASRVPLGTMLVHGSVSEGTVVPGWLARAACDVKIEPIDNATYRERRGPEGLVTARSFVRGLSISVWQGVWSVWPGVLIAAAVAAVLISIGR